MPSSPGGAPRPLLEHSDAVPELFGLQNAPHTAADPSVPLPARLEALEDAWESEVGDTPLIRARGLERRTGLRQIYLKVEGDNPTGTQKDRIAFAQVHDALRRGWDTVCFATCGNYGVAMAYAARFAGLACIAVVPESYHAPRLAQIETLGTTIVREGQDYEAAVQAARLRSAADGHYDANPGGDNETLQLHAYRAIADEIYDDLRDAPAAVAVPVSNGTTLSGIHRGFVSLQRRGRTSRIPQHIGGSAYRKNPVVRSWRLGHAHVRDLDPDRVRETEINEPLINWHAIDGQPALEALHSTSGYAADVTDKRLRELARWLRDDQGLHVLPASTAGLAALLALHAEDPRPPDRYVAVLTGRAS